MNKKDFEGIATFILLLLGATAIIKIIDEANKLARYKCPRCGKDIIRNQNPCPHCGSPIRWRIYG